MGQRPRTDFIRTDANKGKAQAAMFAVPPVSKRRKTGSSKWQPLPGACTYAVIWLNGF